MYPIRDKYGEKGTTLETGQCCKKLKYIKISHE